MKTHQLFISVAAAMLTLASISVINFNVAPSAGPAPAPSATSATPVVTFAAVQVYPHADELRAAALLVEDGSPANVDTPDSLGTQTTNASFQLLESQVAMPYYSFGKKFGRASKE